MWSLSSEERVSPLTCFFVSSSLPYSSLTSGSFTTSLVSSPLAVFLNPSPLQFDHCLLNRSRSCEDLTASAVKHLSSMWTASPKGAAWCCIDKQPTCQTKVTYVTSAGSTVSKTSHHAAATNAKTSVELFIRDEFVKSVLCLAGLPAVSQV